MTTKQKVLIITGTGLLVMGGIVIFIFRNQIFGTSDTGGTSGTNSNAATLVKSYLDEHPEIKQGHLDAYNAMITYAGNPSNAAAAALSKKYIENHSYLKGSNLYKLLMPSLGITDADFTFTGE